MDRPGCVRVLDLPEEARPRLLNDAKGVRSTVRAVGDTADLTRMGVWLRTVQPGDAGTAHPCARAPSSASRPVPRRTTSWPRATRRS